MSRRVIIGLISLCLFIESKAQLSVSEISQKYTAHQATWSRTKLHLLFNQEKYAPGDTVLFKAYFLREDLSRVRGKQIIEVNLVDAKGQSAVGIKFHVNNGVGRDQLIIPGTLTAGMYFITAHNSWMKNFDPSLIFKKKFPIVKKNELMEVEKPFLHVAAEGGHLISNVPNKIIVHTHLAKAAVQINDGAGQEIGRALTDENGTGSLLFTPASNISYSARLVNDTIHMALPRTETDGVSIQLNHGSSDEPVKLILASPVTSSYLGKELFVVITGKAQILFATSVKHTLRDSVEVKPSDLPEGLVQASVLDPSEKVLASRYFYNYRKNSVSVNVQADQRVYQTRDKIKLNITINDQEGKPMEGEFSIRAVNASLFEEEQSNAFPDELTLLSEVKMPYRIDRKQEHWQSSLDHFLITTTEALPWSTILSKQLPVPAHLSSNVIEKKGRAYFADSDKPLPDLTQISFYLQHNKEYIQTFTTENGKVGFTIPQFFGDDEFFYMAQLLNQDDIANIRIEWEEDVFPLPVAPLAKELARPDAYAVFMERKRLIDQSFGIHGHLNDILPSTSAEINDLWEADVTINVDDYVAFPTLQELIKEVVPSMYYRKTKKGDVVRVYLPSPLQATTSPLYIIDGIATRNTAFFLSLKPSEIKTIKIVNTRTKINEAGLLGKYGIVIVATKQGNMREPLDTDSKHFKGLDIPLPLNMHDRPVTNSLIPDFRSTVYWNPSVKTDANGSASVEFFGSDDIGKISLYLEGFVIGVKPFSAHQDIQVVVSPVKN